MSFNRLLALTNACLSTTSIVCMTTAYFAAVTGVALYVLLYVLRF